MRKESESMTGNLNQELQEMRENLQGRDELVAKLKESLHIKTKAVAELERQIGELPYSG